MRASGRGGRQGPRGDRIPPRALLRFAASKCSQVPFRVLEFYAISLFVEEFCLVGLSISGGFVIAL